MIVDIDLQTHTDRSPSCGWMSPETLVERAVAVGLDGVAVTDHNTMGGVEAARRASDEDLLVVAGEEIDTPEGQVIGLLLSERIDPWQPLEDVIAEIHDQGGVAVAPHPFDGLRDGLTPTEDSVGALDAIESPNARCLRSKYNRRASEFARARGLPETGGSDAHFPVEVGTAYTRIETETSGIAARETLRRAVADAIRRGDTVPVGKRSSPLVHAGTKLVKWWNRLRE